jgi:hypothetical protein
MMLDSVAVLTVNIDSGTGLHTRRMIGASRR